jgi:ribosome maturation factor RimP
MGLKEQIQNLLEEKLSDVEVVEVILGKARGQLHIQILLDREGGVNLDFLTRHNRIIGDLLEAQIPSSYLLEVSSAGLERALVRPENYTRFAGRKAKLTLKEPVNNAKTLTGILAHFRADNQVVVFSVDDQELEIPYANITKANLVYEF